MSLYNATTLRETRKALSLTQKDLAQKLEISVKTLQRYEKGSEIPSTISDKLYLLENQLVMQYKERAQEELKMTEELSRVMIEKKTKQRKAQDFNPSTKASVDKIRLSEMLSSDTVSRLENYMNKSLGNDPNVRYWKGNGTKSGKHNWELHWDDCKVYVGFEKYIGGVLKPLYVIEFNPNKWRESSNPYLPKLLSFMGINPKIHSVDICKDIVGIKPQQVISISNPNEQVRKTYEDASKGRTKYVGEKNKDNNNLMVYDKRHELLKMDGKEVDCDITRLETRIKYKPSVELFAMEELSFKLNMPVVDFIANKTISGAEGTMSIWMAHAMQILNGNADIDLLDRESRERMQVILESMEIQQAMISEVDIRQAIELFKIRYVNFYVDRCKMSQKQKVLFEDIYMRGDNRIKYDSIISEYERMIAR